MVPDSKPPSPHTPQRDEVPSASSERTRNGKALREGFTTGTAAAAAAAGAVLRLAGLRPEAVSVPLPPFSEKDALFPLPAGHPRLSIPLEPPADAAAEKYSMLQTKPSTAEAFSTASATVVKDGGDDPDATHRMSITVAVSRRPFFSAENAGHLSGSRSLDDIPEDEEWSALLELAPGVFLSAGPGVGRVTLPGLPVSPGEPAVNPQPRRQIAAAVLEAAHRVGLSGPLYLRLSAPEGKERAKHTLNGRLGITGGISILGTQGIVRPYSHDAWQCSVSQGISVAKALGLSTVLFSTGRRSEKALFGLYPHLPPAAGVQAADFAAHALRQAGKAGFAEVVWGCFPGKLLKLAQRLEWTHAKGGEADLALLLSFARRHGADEETLRRAEVLPTAAGVFALLEKESSALHTHVLRDTAEAAQKYALGLLLQGAAEADAGADAAATQKPAPVFRLHVFSLEDGRLLLTV